MKNALCIQPLLVGLCALLFLSSCDKGSRIDNELPETKISINAINLSGEDRLNSLVNLKWWGTDPDGFIKGYEFSFDQETWYFTPEQDSTFLFSINAGSDTIDIDFWVRAMDNQDALDDTPAYLRVPLKNTPPVIEFDDELIQSDTAFSITGLTWIASDLDGDNTIEDIQLKINEGEWTSVSTSQNFASIIPDNPKNIGATSSTLFYDLGIEGPSIEGLLLDQPNNIYIKAIDIAGSESEMDTVANLVVTAQKNDLLLINANAANTSAFYAQNCTQAGATFDVIDFVRDDSKNLPKVWNPVFTQYLNLYKTVILYANDVDFANPQTGTENIIAELASTSIENYINGGGRLLISTNLPNDFSADSPLNGILPMDSISSSEGQARLPIDSLVIGTDGYPTLTCQAFISGLDPFYPSTDAVPFYTAQLTKNSGWDGPSIVGAKRQNANGNTNLIFISVQLHLLNKDQTAMQTLFNRILNDEFNW